MKRLCCGRGYQTRWIELEEKCNCRFVWCCQVACDMCKQRKELHRCNWKIITSIKSFAGNSLFITPHHFYRGPSKYPEAGKTKGLLIQSFGYSNWFRVQTEDLDCYVLLHLCWYWWIYGLMVIYSWSKRTFMCILFILFFFLAASGCILFLTFLIIKISNVPFLATGINFTAESFDLLF